MKSGYRILIFGNGRIGRGVFYYLKQDPLIRQVAFFSQGQDIAKYDLLVGALAGGLGTLPLRIALKHKKDLIDISDVEPEFYLKKKRESAHKGIAVVACCGFCPGLINFILGRELAAHNDIRAIEIKAGSLSPQKDYFPFLWCFEDLILEHRIPSWQIIKGKIKKFPPFSGYLREKFFAIEAESYFAQSGFENMMEGLRIKDFSFRVLRPYGFMAFFRYLENEGFLKKDTLAISKKIVERKIKENITLGTIDILTPDKKVTWQMKSSSGPGERLNSMQKITAITPAAMAKSILRGLLKGKGVFFMEELGRDDALFGAVLKENKLRKVEIVKSTRSI